MGCEEGHDTSRSRTVTLPSPGHGGLLAVRAKLQPAKDVTVQFILWVRIVHTRQGILMLEKPFDCRNVIHETKRSLKWARPLDCGPEAAMTPSDFPVTITLNDCEDGLLS